MNKRKTFGIALLVLALVLSGCTSNQVITSLEVAVQAVTVALPVLSALGGIPPDLANASVSYASAVNQALSQASQILDSTGTDAEHAALIAAAFAGIAVPVVPAQYQALASVIQALATDVAHFLGGLPGASIAMARTSGPAHFTKWSDAEKGRITAAHQKAVANAVVLAALRK